MVVEMDSGSNLWWQEIWLKCIVYDAWWLKCIVYSV